MPVVRIRVPNALFAAAILLLVGCNRTNRDQVPSVTPAPSSPPARGLGSAEASVVLAKVGDVTITLGDYAAALDRMDRFERLRYQTEDRRQQLLDELIQVELLAQEAKRQNLDADPEVRTRLDEALRDEVLRDLRSQIPAPEALPQAEVRAYYDAHRAEFREPERRRIAAIVVNDEAKAKELALRAKAADPAAWGELVRQHSIASRPNEQTPVELEGDLGIITAPDQPRGNGPILSRPILEAAFTIQDLGGVHPTPVRDGKRFYVLRLTGRTEARDRSFAEAERSIRVRMVEQRMADAEQKLIEDLRRQYPVTLDEGALARIPVPAARPRENLKNALGH